MFYYSGHSPYLPTNAPIQDSKQNPKCSMPVYICGLLCVLLSISCAFLLNSFFSRNSFELNRTDLFISNMFILSQFARAILVLLQCICYRKTYYNIIDTFNKLELFFANQLHHQIQFSILKEGAATKMTIAAIAFAQLLTIEIVSCFIYPKFNQITVQIKLLQMITTFTFVHLIFFIDVLCFYLEQLRLVIVRDTNNDRSLDSIGYHKYSNKCVFIRTQLKNYKSVHFCLWEVGQRINIFFGWSMISILLQAFVDFLYSSYWLFDLLQEPFNLITFVRTYF